jgi:hypothetical protein
VLWVRRARDPGAGYLLLVVSDARSADGLRVLDLRWSMIFFGKPASTHRIKSEGMLFRIML